MNDDDAVSPDGLNRFYEIVRHLGPVDMTPGVGPVSWGVVEKDDDRKFDQRFVYDALTPSATSANDRTATSASAAPAADAYAELRKAKPKSTE